jgi:hypothetical protein
MYTTSVKSDSASVGQPRILLAATNDVFLPTVQEVVLAENGGEAAWKESTEALSSQIQPYSLK